METAAHNELHSRLVCHKLPAPAGTECGAVPNSNPATLRTAVRTQITATPQASARCRVELPVFHEESKSCKNNTPLIGRMP